MWGIIGYEMLWMLSYWSWSKFILMIMMLIWWLRHYQEGSLKIVVRSPVWWSPPYSCEEEICWVFLAPFLWGVKAQMRRLILSHLFKCKGIKLGWERDSFVREKQLQNIEKKERKSHCEFRTPTRKCFSDCNCNSFTIGSGGCLDNKFYTCDTSNCPIRLSKWYLEKEINVLHFLFCIWCFPSSCFSIVSIGAWFWFGCL